MTAKRLGILAALLVLAAAAVYGQTERRSAYSYVREVSGDVTVVSGLNGTVDARRNLPISPGDEVKTDDPGRAEIALADGNVLHVGGGTSVQFVSLYAQQGSDDEVSAISLREGSVVLSVLGPDEKAVPRIDTEDLTVYTNSGSRVRVNADPRRGSAVVVRAGSVEVRTPSGSYTVRAGNYMLAQGDQEPEIARGSFSRDRFDNWVADRLEVTYDAPRNASSQYVGEDYASDVASLDGYGNWDYNSSYSTYVWRPSVGAGWTPYSNGSWYYTPAGLTWWSGDSWGWYPFHYGNWFFDAGWNSWCWAPGSVYSPAWVYWAYTPSYVGWCPVGWYGPFYSPWWDSYYKNWSYPRNSLAFAINGNYSTRRVDFRGWNFTGSSGFGTTRGRVDVIPGTRVADRLGNHMAVSSRPIVVGARTGVGVRESLRDYVREAPRTIERTAAPDADRLEPVLARDRVLPRATVDALRGRSVVTERGRLSGPGAMDIAPRGATVIERGRGAVHVESARRIETDPATGRTMLRETGRSVESPDRTARPDVRRSQPRAETPDSWRGRTGTAPATAPLSRTGESPRTSRDAESANHEQRAQVGSENWRAPTDAPRTRNEQQVAPDSRRTDDWRTRGQVPPARRVIEGAVPGRRTPDFDGSGGDRRYPMAPSPQAATRDRGDYGQAAPRGGQVPPPGAPRSIERAPAPSAPPPQAAPAPRPAPAPAPPSHSAPSAPAPRPAPPSSSGRPGRS